MSFKFDPAFWFVCGKCRQAFGDTKTFKKHKLEKHLGDCLRVKSIVFEERIIEPELVIVPDVASPTKSNTDSGIVEATATSPQEGNDTLTALNSLKNVPNPYVSLEPLIAAQDNSFSAPKNLIDHSHKKNCNEMQSPPPLSPSISSVSSLSSDKEKSVKTNPFEIKSSPSPKRRKIDNDNLNEDCSQVESTSSVPPSFVLPSPLPNTDSTEGLIQNTPSPLPSSEVELQPNRELEIESREYIKAYIITGRDGSKMIKFEATVFPTTQDFPLLKKHKVPLTTVNNDDDNNKMDTADSPIITNSNKDVATPSSESCQTSAATNDTENCVENTNRQEVDETEAADSVMSETDSPLLSSSVQIEFDATIESQEDEIMSQSSNVNLDDFDDNGSPTINESCIAIDCNSESEASIATHQDTRTKSADLEIISESRNPDNPIFIIETQTSANVDLDLDFDLDQENSAPLTNQDLKPRIAPLESSPETEPSNSRYTRRKRVKVNYTETQLCTLCKTDFYTVEELEDHERLCKIRHRKNASTQPFSANRDVKPYNLRESRSQNKINSLVPSTEVASESSPEIITVDDDDDAQDKDWNKSDDDDENIPVTETDVPLDDSIIDADSDNEIEVLADDSVNDKDSDYEIEVLEESSVDDKDSDSDSISDDFDLPRKQKVKEVSKDPVTTRTTVRAEKTKNKEITTTDTNTKSTTTNKKSSPRQLSRSSSTGKEALALNEWLKFEKEKIARGLSANIIRIETDPTLSSKSSKSKSKSTTPLPIICKLCHLILEYPKETVHFKIKNHLENCWFHNKSRHRHCIQCDYSFSSVAKFKRHQKYDHKVPDEVKNGKNTNNSEEEESDDDKESKEDQNLDLDVWLKKKMEKIQNREQLLVKENKPLPSKLIALIPDPLKWGYEKVVPSKTKKVYCGLCNYELSSENEVREHVQTCWRYNKSEHMYCIPCRKQCSSIVGLNRHNYLEHTIGPKFPFFCDNCCTGFLSKKELEDHSKSRMLFQQIVGRENTSDAGAEEADYEERSLNAHDKNDIASLVQWLKKQKEKDPSNIILLDPNPLVQKNLPPISEDNSIACQLCLRSFSSLTVLKSHATICFRYNKRIHRFCVKCNFLFKTSKRFKEHNFRRHRKVHSGEKPFQDGLGFTGAESFKNHRKEHDEKDKEEEEDEGGGEGGKPKATTIKKKKFQFHFRGRKFSSTTSLDTHEKIQQREKTKSTNSSDGDSESSD